MIPKNFIPGKNRKLKIEKKKPAKIIRKLEDLIAHETELGCRIKAKTEEIYNSDITFGHLGVDPRFVKRKILVRYYKDNRAEYDYCQSIFLIEYESKLRLEEDLSKIYTLGIASEPSKTVYEKFLFKDNFAIFIMDPGIREEAIPYYRNLGFKQLERTLRII